VRFRTITTAAILSLLAAPDVRAEGKSVDEASPTERKEAGQIYSDAMADFDKDALEKALAGFRDSYHHVRSPNSHFMIARSLARLGRNAEAYAELDSVIAEADALGTRYADTSRAAGEKREQVRPRVALLTIHVAHAPKGAKYTLGGEPFDPRRLDKPIAVDPGESKVVVTPPGGVEQPWTKTIQAGDSGTIEIDLAPGEKSGVGAAAASHRPYLLEIQGHVVGETLDPPGPAVRGAGVGGRLALEISKTGVLDAMDSLALTAGADWIGTNNQKHVWIPLALQWNVWVLPKFSLFFEPGVALMVGAGTHGSPALDVGVRYQLWRSVSAVGRLGIPGATIGVSLLL
jgi:hypothetical protein